MAVPLASRASGACDSTPGSAATTADVSVLRAPHDYAFVSLA